MSHKYELLSKLGQGQFGSVYLGKKRRGTTLVAIKIEYQDSPYRMLKHEARILHYLYEKGCASIPTVFWYGLYEQHLGMAMSYYETSLENLVISGSMSSDSKNSEYYLEKMLDVVGHIHDHFVIHCDIKPQNFMIRNGNLFLIDFGLSKLYVDEDKRPVVETKIGDTILGTPKYISLYIHEGHSPARRDDVISCLYVYLFSKMKTLPWENIPENATEVGRGLPPIHIDYYKNTERKRLKQSTNEALKVHPLGILLQRAYACGFDERPCYKIDPLILSDTSK